jgi:hypothetical protein
MEKISHLHNGQWTLAKSNQRFDDKGEVHEVEVHPDMDDLYRVKGMINNSGRPHLSLQDIKRTGEFNHLINKIPRDAQGRVTSQMLDDHINKLPKHKVLIRTAPYTWGSQLHDENANENEHTVSIQMHPETLDKLDTNTRNAFNHISPVQHRLVSKGKNQIGWARIDHGKDNHWHIDEIQSDFNNSKKIDRAHEAGKQYAWKQAQIDFQKEVLKYSPDHPHRQLQESVAGSNILRNQYDPIKPNASKEDAEKWREIIRTNATKRVQQMEPSVKAGKDGLLSTLSHGHEDPQHLIHSAINALARKKGINSISMDTPEDQAKQSGLRSDLSNDDQRIAYLAANHSTHWQNELNRLNSGYHPALANPNFKSALDKIGIDGLTAAADGTVGAAGSIDLPGNIYNIEAMPELERKFKSLSVPESDAVHDMLFNHERNLENLFRQKSSEFDITKLPVHFLNTYYKRPKKLGYKTLPKKDVMDYSNDSDQQVQYSPVFKTIKKLKDKLNKIKGRQ